MVDATDGSARNSEPAPETVVELAVTSAEGMVGGKGVATVTPFPVLGHRAGEQLLAHRTFQKGTLGKSASDLSATKTVG